MNRTLALTLIMFSEFALANEAQFAEKQKKALEMINQRMEKLEERKSCIESATKMQDLRNCRIMKKNMPAKGKAPVKGRKAGEAQPKTTP